MWTVTPLKTQKGSATVGSVELTILRLGNATDTNLRVERGLERIGGSAATVGSLELKTVPRQSIITKIRRSGQEDCEACSDNILAAIVFSPEG